MIEAPKMPKKMKFFLIGQYQFIASLVIFTLWFQAIRQPWDYIALILAIVADAFACMYLVYIRPLKKRDEANLNAMGIDFFEGPIIALKTLIEDFFLGFKSYTKLNINWDNDVSIAEMFESKIYKDYLRDLLKDETTKEFRQEKSITIFEKEIINALDNEFQEFKKKLEEKKQIIPEDLKELKKKEKELEDSKKGIYPFRQFKLNMVEETDKAILKKLNFYFVDMYASERFENQESGFNKCIVITNKEWSKVLQTRPSKEEYRGWEIDTHKCQVTWILWYWMTDNIPVLYLRFSENMIEEEIDDIVNMRAITMTYQQLKVLERWNYYLSTLPEKLIKENELLQQKINSIEYGFEYFLQDKANDNLIYSKFLRNPVQAKLLENLNTEKRRTQVLLLSLCFVGIIIFIIILFFSSSSGFKFI